VEGGESPEDDDVIGAGPDEEIGSEDESGGPIPVDELGELLERATGNGLFPAITHGLDPSNPEKVVIATCSIGDLPVTRSIVETVHGHAIHPYRYVPIKTLEYVAETNHTVTLYEGDVAGFRSDLREHRRALGHLVHYCTASRWPQKAFALVDMVAFSTRSSSEQLSLRMSLGQAITQCQQRMYRLVPKTILRDTRFNKISTGDGFYLWSYDDSPFFGHLATFTLMVLLMAQVRELEEKDAVRLELRAAFGTGEAFVFPYDGPSVPPRNRARTGFRPDAIGPVLNTLSRLLDQAYPSQILVHPFDLDGRPDRTDEHLDVETMLTIVSNEVLPQELKHSDTVKPQEVNLRANPSTPYRIVDKHLHVHHCINVTGTVATRERGQVIGKQEIGVHPDKAVPLESASFVRN
jgi:hypothetical protein